MSIVTFWNDGKEQTGKTMSVAAIATYLAIEHNYKILIISTGYKKTSLNKCFFEERKVTKSRGIFGPNTNLELEDGISGLAKIMKSNKLSADIITNYTRIVFKERLEVLQSFTGEYKEYEEIRRMYADIANLANNYYDLVFVDLDAEMGEEQQTTLLNNSNVVVVSLSQRLSSINNFMQIRENNQMLKSNKIVLLIGRYDKFSKYSIKNISRYMGEKNKVSTIPYNTLYFEACSEGKAIDFFLRLKNLDENDRNRLFVNEANRADDAIIYKLQELQMKI